MLTESFLDRSVVLMIGDVAMAAAVVVTIYSGYDYVVKNMSFLKDAK
jgi:phosphatidylglycerophosphate synthase